MRSELVRTPILLSDHGHCHFCQSLGYLNFTKISKEHFTTQLSNLKFSASEIIVFHISILNSFQKKELAGHVDAGKKIKFLGCLACLEVSQLPKFDFMDFAPIVRDITELSAAVQIFNFSQIYFLVSIKNFTLSEFDLISSDLRKKIHFFSSYQAFNNLSGIPQLQWLELSNQLRNRDPFVSFDTPFSHDVIDARNPNHLDWIFPPNRIFNGKSAAEPSIKISVIIPFFCRRNYVLKVLRALHRQSLPPSNFEVILLDDGSPVKETNALKKDLDQFSGLNLQLHRIERDVNLKPPYIGNRVGPIRNLGAAVSGGTILLFLDSDILISSHYLAELSQMHETHDVVLPRRLYLGEVCSTRADGSMTEFSSADFMTTPWDVFMNRAFEAGDWPRVQFPWKYFMTYCLSMKRNLFDLTGGFRSNYISYGYEDIDLGYRIFLLTHKCFLTEQSVFHLFHFHKDAEYDLKSFSRYFQLALSSRTFVMQNAPAGNHFLDTMVRFRSSMAKFFYLWYFWRPWK